MTMEPNVKILRLEQIEKSKANEYRLFKYVFAGTILSFLTLFTIVAKAQHQEGLTFNNTNENGVILDGYDPVAFFTDNKPVKGDAQFQFTYDKAIYYFASRAHLDLFKANPEKYKPQ